MFFIFEYHFAHIFIADGKIDVNGIRAGRTLEHGSGNVSINSEKRFLNVIKWSRFS